MAYVIDVTQSGGELVVLGDTIVLPESSDTTTQYLLGSLRYNPVSNAVEVYVNSTIGGVPTLTWEQITLSQSALSSYLPLTGGTLSGSLSTSSSFLASDGNSTSPSISFANHQTTGFHANGTSLSTTINGVDIVNFTSSGTSFNNPISITNNGSMPVILDVVNGCLVISSTGSIVIPNGNTAERQGTAGALRFNSDLNLLEYFDGSQWGQLVNNINSIFPNITISSNSNNWIETIDTSGNLVFEKISGTPLIKFDGSGNIVSTGNITGNQFIGSSTSSLYADLAERYEADNVYDVGTVLVIGGEKEVTISLKENDIAVAGIVSKNPGFRLNENAGNDDTHPFVALKGRVPCKVTGPIKKGDCLVTSNIPGYAKAATVGSPDTAIIGKALADFNEKLGIIEVKV